MGKQKQIPSSALGENETKTFGEKVYLYTKKHDKKVM